MRSSYPHRIALLSLLVCLGAGSRAQAKSRDIAPYLGLSWSRLSLGGDFDGTRQLAFVGDTQDDFTLPKFDSGSGYVFVAGVRGGPFGMELYYQQGGLANSSAGIRRDRKATLHEFGTSIKGYFFSSWMVHPFINMGCSLPWVNVPAGGVRVPTTDVNEPPNDANAQTNEDVEASYRGIGWHGGFGLSFFPIPQLSIEGSFIYRYRHFMSLNKVNLGGLELNSGGFEPFLAVSYHFIPFKQK